MAKTPYHKTGEIKPNVFTQILMTGEYEGIIPARTKEAREWYRQQALAVGNVSSSELMKSDHTRFRGQPASGRMFMFYYDPKHKATLPYYDRFPLIFPLNISLGAGSFMGLNLHYLPPMYRAKLMDFLYQYVSNNRYDQSTKMQIETYKGLKAFSQSNYYKPCIKKYLTRHVRSRFVSVAANEWDIAMMLPLAKFEKAPDTKVWSDSVKKINYGRKY